MQRVGVTVWRMLRIGWDDPRRQPLKLVAQETRRTTTVGIKHGQCEHDVTCWFVKSSSEALSVFNVTILIVWY